MSMPTRKLLSDILPLKRTTGRGLKKCPSCGNINGQRATICRNESCSLRQSMLLNQRPYDPIQLITHNKTALYSIRKKETKTQLRNFVQISEVTLALETAETAIVSRKAICFEDTCKFDATNITGLYCKHLNACTVGDQYSLNRTLPQAEVYNVEQQILFNLHITLQQKQRIWQLYMQEDMHIPAVQKLNTIFFAVKCEQNKNFAAGRLHVRVPTNVSSTKRESMYNCSCKKIKLLLDADNSVVMQPEVCDHLLLVLAAVLSQTEDRKQLYAHFLNAYKSYWCEEEEPQNPIEHNMGISFAQTQAEVDSGVFIFDPNFLSDDVTTNMPDLSDIIMELNPANLLPQTEHIQGVVTQTHDQQTSFNSSFNSNLDDLSFLAGDINISPTELELTDCNIELMDQFDQLTDQIDLCSEDLELPLESTEFLKANNLSFLTNLPSVLLTTPAIPASPPPIELPTIAVVKPNEAKVRQFPQTMATKETQIVKEKEPSLKFNMWLDNVIETVNESIQIQDQKNIKLSFQVHEDIFAHFSKTFSIGSKRRVPNKTIVLKHGRHKGLTKYIWKFLSPSTVRRIFSTQNLTLDMERCFECDADGNYIPYSRGPDISIPCSSRNHKLKRIYPKISLHKVHMYFNGVDMNLSPNQNTGLEVEWVPNVFPKSNFGIMNVVFSLTFKEPQKLPGEL